MDSLTLAVIGCSAVGQRHAEAAASLPHYRVVAGCDMNSEALQVFTEAFPTARGYTDYATMLEEAKPDVVVVATSTASHAPLTIQAAEAGARGVYCEKPMAVSMAEAWAMVAACKKYGTALAVNHQRRTYPVFKTMRRLMQEGAIGQVELIRGGCAGDMLSDGTHLIDTIRFLAGDAEVKWLLGQIHRDEPDPNEAPRGTLAYRGRRYGHAVETGAMAVFEFETGLRAEIFTGTLQTKGRHYQDYEVFGSQGRLHRAGDSVDPPLLMQTTGGWRPVEIDSAQDGNVWKTLAGADNYRLFAETIRSGTKHPLSGDSAVKDHEVVMAVYESARLHDKIRFPLTQERYPLDLMLEEGERL